MVKHSGQIKLQSGGGRNLGYVGKGCKGVNVSKSGNKYDCKNKIYGYKKGGKKRKGLNKDYCKKHFDNLKPKDWNSKNKTWIVYPKDFFKPKNDLKVCQRNGCITIGYKKFEDLMLCKFHFDRSRV